MSHPGPEARPDDQPAMPGLVRSLFCIDLALVAVYAVNFAIGQPSYFLTRLVDLNAEANLPTWAASLQLAAIALLLLLTLPRHPRGSPAYRAVLGLGALMLFLSLDESATIHEWVGTLSDRFLHGGTREGTLVPRTGIWMFLLVPAVLLWVWWFVRPLLNGPFRPPKIRWLGAFGLLALLGGAGGVDLLSNFVAVDSLSGTVMVILEEGSELVGQTLLVWAAYLIWMEPSLKPLLGRPTNVSRP